jgi:hypothetical protein
MLALCRSVKAARLDQVEKRIQKFNLHSGPLIVFFDQ